MHASFKMCNYKIKVYMMTYLRGVSYFIKVICLESINVFILIFFIFNELFEILKEVEMFKFLTVFLTKRNYYI